MNLHVFMNIFFILAGIDNEEFYETQMIWKTQIKRRFESLKMQGAGSYLYRANLQCEELSQQKLDELR